jgi:hypothetical protein
VGRKKEMGESDRKGREKRYLKLNIISWVL